MDAPSKARKPSVRRSQGERSAETRRRLVDAAICCLNERGFQGATVAVIADQASVSRGAVQHHFGTRGELLIAVIEEFGQALGTFGVGAEALAVADRIDRAIDSTWEVMRSPLFIAVVQIWLATRSDSKIFPLVRNTINRFEEDLDARWKDVFACCGTMAELAVVVRHLLLATLRGLALRNSVRPGRVRWEREITVLKSMILRTLQGEIEMPADRLLHRPAETPI